jgi:hypothetical protein
MKLYTLVWGQSSISKQSKIETHLDFQQCKNEYDSLKLIRSLESSRSKVMTDNININLRTKQKRIIIIYVKLLI